MNDSAAVTEYVMSGSAAVTEYADVGDGTGGRQPVRVTDVEVFCGGVGVATEK